MCSLYISYNWYESTIVSKKKANFKNNYVKNANGSTGKADKIHEEIENFIWVKKL